MAPRLAPPKFPIIYVRGYAGSQEAVEATVSTPYMGFNLGSTKIRQAWTGELKPVIFESPLVRLMKDFGYRDVYHDGKMLPKGHSVYPRSVIIYRFYDQVSKELGTGDRPDIPVFAKELGELIEKLRDRICKDNGLPPEDFRVYLVAHSMGGLIVRCFLQHPPEGTPPLQDCVEKVFTYATPHNGIDFRLLGNLPTLFSGNNVHNFNRRQMAKYLGLVRSRRTPRRVDTLNNKYPNERFFTLVGTNAGDYDAGAGPIKSRSIVGPLSDGLVRIENATLQGCPRAFVHRSHSGDYGIVNSEEGYQNLTRFLFGDVRVDGLLRVEQLTLHPDPQREKTENKARIRASYHFEVALRPRGARYDLSRRLVSENSAIFRTYDQIFHPDRVEGLKHHRHPHLFSVYLSSAMRTVKPGPLVFSVTLRIPLPDYEIDERPFEHHFRDSAIYNQTFLISVTPPPKGKHKWKLHYNLDDEAPAQPGGNAAESDGSDGAPVFRIPIRSKAEAPGIVATLELTVRPAPPSDKS